MPTIAELFDKDPRELTREERDQIVQNLRESRKLWLEESVKAKARGGRAPAVGGAKAAGLGKSVSLDDLGIDL